MMTCATCGSELGIGRFCTNCGAPVSEAPVATAEPDWGGHTVIRPRAGVQAFVPPPAPEPARPTAPAPEPSPREIPRWLPWLLGWLLLAVLAATLGWTVGSGDGTSTSGAAGTTTSGPFDGASDPSPAPVPSSASLPADASDITAAATAAAPDTAPPNQDLSGDAVTYDAIHMLDGDPATAWRMSGDGTGVVLTFMLPEATRLASVGLVNGYAKVDGSVDWYPLNRRITSITWGFDDGSTLRQDLIDSPAMQTIGTDDVVTSSVTLTLTTVSEPGASDGRDFTPVSDVRLIGSAA